MKRIFPMIRKETPVLDMLRQKKGGGIETGVTGRVRMVPDFILRNRGVLPSVEPIPITPSPKPRPRSSFPKPSHPRRSRSRRPQPPVEREQPREVRKAPKKNISKHKGKRVHSRPALLTGNPPKLVREYAASMAKSTGLSPGKVLKSEPVQNYWRKHLE